MFRGVKFLLQERLFLFFSFSLTATSPGNEMMRVVLFLAFLALAFAGDDTVDTNCQFCECGLPDEDERRSCEALECCKVFHSLTRFQNFINNDPFNPRSVVKGDLVASCLCCSCANVTCSSNVAYTLDSTSTQSGDGAKQNLNQKPVVQMTRDSVEEHGFTLADYHRGLLKDRTRIETRGDELNCDDFSQHCVCSAETSCSDLDCCSIENTLDLNRDAGRMVTRGASGNDILLSCDCCGCASVDCENDVVLDIDVSVVKFE